MKRWLMAIVLCMAAKAQTGGPIVNPITGAAPPSASQVIYVYSSNNLVYRCIAPSTTSQTTVTVTAASNASAASFTATSHGFDYQSGVTVSPVISIQGATGNWTPINGVWLATISSANAFTIPVDSTTFGALTGTLVVTTVSPRTNQKQWAIQHFVYDGTPNLIWSGWAVNPDGAASTNLVGGASSYTFACASRANYAYQ